MRLPNLSLIGVRARVVEFLYPLRNLTSQPSQLLLRRVFVEDVRDLRIHPIPSSWLRLRPNVNRGPILFIGHDVIKGARRQFYLHAAHSLQELDMRLYQVGIFDPCSENSKVRFAGPVLTDSAEDKQYARELLKEVRRRFARQSHGLVAELFPYEETRDTHAPFIRASQKKA